MRGNKLINVLLGIGFAITQLTWLWVSMIVFTMLGYDGGGFAGGVILPVVGVLIAFAPSLLAGGWVLARGLRQLSQVQSAPLDAGGH